ncbi:hypothetical protein [Mesorhizobium sp. 128a]
MTGSTFRILRITPHFYRPGIWPAAFDPVGGLQNQTWIIAQGMDSAGVSQTVLTTYIPGSPRQVQLSPRMRVKCAGWWLPLATSRSRPASVARAPRCTNSACEVLPSFSPA